MGRKESFYFWGVDIDVGSNIKSMCFLKKSLEWDKERMCVDYIY